MRSLAAAKDGGSGVGRVAKSFYLINPRESVPGYFGLEVSSQAIGGLEGTGRRSYNHDSGRVDAFGLAYCLVR